MGKKDKDFKFIVGNPHSLCSRLWSVKIRKDDVYIMNEHGKEHKISLHKSGFCHSAVTTEAAPRIGMSREQRTAVSWKLTKKSEIAFAIIVPSNQLKKHVDMNMKTANILFIPSPPVFSSVAIYFIKTKFNGEIKNFGLNLDKGLYHLHSVQLASGDIITVLYYYTSGFNKMIEKADKAVHSFSLKNMPPAPLKLDSGFVTMSDSNGINYHIDINLDDMSISQ